MSVRISVTGDKELDSKLKAMSAKMSHSVLGAAHYAAAKPLIEKARLLAPEGPNGYLVDSIGAIKTPSKKANEVGEVKAGPRRRAPYKGFHGHLVERGTKERETKSGANRGVMPEHPFMEPAFNQTKGTIESRIRTELKKQILSVVKKGRA